MRWLATAFHGAPGLMMSAIDRSLGKLDPPIAGWVERQLDGFDAPMQPMIRFKKVCFVLVILALLCAELTVG